MDDAIRLVSEENKDDPKTENKQHPVKEESQPWLLLLTTTNQVFYKYILDLKIEGKDKFYVRLK